MCVYIVVTCNGKSMSQNGLCDILSEKPLYRGGYYSSSAIHISISTSSFAKSQPGC